ncbi:MAG: hypothetical protein RSA95_14425 [Citrobacter sp.]|uniref:hypothetical protein n=1 Tax=Citrobacter sp. TaxID=1896336 RepID=UPI002FC8DEE0
MGADITQDQLDAKTPSDVKIRSQARTPDFDPTLGIPVALPEVTGVSANKLVVIGDSISAGFQSGAIFNTRLSWPKIVAYEAGCDRQFRYPLFDGYGGLPLNIEYLLRQLEQKYGSKISLWEIAGALFEIRHQMALIEDYWERGPGANAPVTTGIMHNLSVYGWDLRDALDRTANNLLADRVLPKDDLFTQFVENANIRAGLGVYSSMSGDDTVLDAAKKLGEQGGDSGGGGKARIPGIGTLVVFLGANNVLGAVTKLEVKWSDSGYNKLGAAKNSYTAWRPEHFAAEYKLLAKKLDGIKAQHVILVNVPHVTIAPIARGVDKKIGNNSRYFPFYTRPWITDEQFNSSRDPKITANEARALDSAIDQYNDLIAQVVKERRLKGQDWYVMDIAGMLDRLAVRRYFGNSQAQPEWWTPYELPAALKALRPTINSRFFSSGPQGRLDGGLFSLDGIHPTTITYGMIAQEIINIMQLARVPFYHADGVTPRRGPVQVDFDRLVRLDSLISKPPSSLAGDLKILGWLDETADLFSRLNPFSK